VRQIFYIEILNDCHIGEVSFGGNIVSGVTTTSASGGCYLDIGGQLSQSEPITTGKLGLRVTGSTTLLSNNYMLVLGVFNEGSIFINDVNDLEIGSVTVGANTVSGF